LPFQGRIAMRPFGSSRPLRGNASIPGASSGTFILN